jgi:hypothetical protein
MAFNYQQLVDRWRSFNDNQLTCPKCQSNSYSIKWTDRELLKQQSKKFYWRYYCGCGTQWWDPEKGPRSLNNNSPTESGLD